MRSGLPAEISMVEDMLIANRKAGIDNGLLEAAYCRLQLYERQRTPSDDKQEILNSQSLDKRTTKNEYNNSRQIPLAGGAS